MTANSTSGIRPDYTPHARAERLITTGRFVLAASSLTAVYLEPSTPAHYESVTYTLLLAYTTYALVTALIAWRARAPSARWRNLSHVGDLVLFSIFVYLTEGPASPFFLYFVFALFCATVRFSWRGILATGVTAIAIYSAMSIVGWYRDPAFEVSRVVIRVTYLGVLTALLVYLGIYQQQLRTELASLAAWPRQLAARIDDVLSVALAYAASVVRAPRVLLVWEDTEEPWVYAAFSSRDEFRVERVPPGTYDEFTGVENATVFVRGSDDSMLVYDPSQSSLTETAGDPIGESLRRRYRTDGGIVVLLRSETLMMRFIVPDVRSATGDELALAHIAGRLILASLEQFLFVQQVRQTASAEERLRISRELHDGIVQSLAGVGLRLQGLRRRVVDLPETAGELEKLQAVLERDQRDLRTIVRELRPHDTREGRAIVEEELQRMRERFSLEWGLDVQVEIGGPVVVPARIAHELCRIVNESLSNAARHGGASCAIVSITPDLRSVGIRVSDNGRGFAFVGRRDLPALEELGLGPRTLKERIRSLGGALVVESSTSGASIEMRIPAEADA